MKVLVTGATGLVGSRIIELLGERFELVPLSREQGFDLTNLQSVGEALFQPADAVLHLAAFTNVDQAWEQSFEHPDECSLVNAKGTYFVAEVCQKTGKYLVFFSTDFVFDGERKGPYTEKDKPHPIEWYGATKLKAENWVRCICPDAAILRISFPFRFSCSRLDLVRWILQGLERGDLPPMFSDQIITPTFVDDLASAVEAVLKQKPSGVYHAVGSTSLSPYRLALQIAQTFGFPKTLIKRGSLEEFMKGQKEEGKEPRPRQKYLALSNDKIFQDLGVSMHTLEDSLKIMKSQRGGG